MTSSSFDLNRRTVLTMGAGAALAPLVAGLSGGDAMAAAPMLGGARGGSHYRFKLGSFEITTLSDGTRPGPGPHPTFGNNQDPAVVAAYAQANFLPSNQFMNSFTPIVLNTGSQLIVFDSGNASAGQPAVGNFVQRLKDAGYDPASVDLVVISHCHGDHIGGLVANGNPAFPNARYAIGRVEYDFWTSTSRIGSPQENGHKLAVSNVQRFAEKMTFLKDNDSVVSGVTALESFGHSPGHMAFHIESGGKRLLLWADVCNHYVMSLQQPDWHASFDADKAMAVASRRKLLDMVATDRIPATGYHMPFPAVGFVEKAGNGYRWLPATYQLDL